MSTSLGDGMLWIQTRCTGKEKNDLVLCAGSGGGDDGGSKAPGQF